MEILLFLMILYLFLFHIGYRKFRREASNRLQRLESQLDHLEGLRAYAQEKTEPADGNAGSGKVPESAPTADGELAQTPPSSQAPPSQASFGGKAAGVTPKTSVTTSVRPAQPPPRPGPQRQARPAAWNAKWQNFKANIDWEQFTGVKLFAWLGGFALFIATGFFVKFTIDRNLIPPAMRLAMGTLTGIGLILGAGRIAAERYAVLRQTLAAGGIGMLYSVIFAATLYYHYLPNPLGFALLALVSSAAFVLAVHHRSLALSILGAVGAYLTPLLVSIDQGDGLLLLYGYLGIVNIGLYQVVRRLKSQALLMTAALGTLAVMVLNTWFQPFHASAQETAWVWIAHMAIFSLFLWHGNQNPDDDKATLVTGVVTYTGTLATSLWLTTRPGWSPLLIQTAAAAGAFFLAWRGRGWYRRAVPFSVMVFLAALIWTWLRFSPAVFSFSYILLLLYGAVGSIGPVLLANKYGPGRSHLAWFKVFPLAIMLMALGVLLREETVSFWFWPLVLFLQLIGIGLSAMLRATLQIFILPVLFLAAGLYWLFGMSGTVIGPGFFFFLLAAGAILCTVLLYAVPRLQQHSVKPCPAAAIPSNIRTPGLSGPAAQWLAASPAVGACVLLGASFCTPFPHYPHPGMFTLLCFVTLLLTIGRRLAIQAPAAAGLLSAVLAQAVWVLRPDAWPGLQMNAMIWSGALFTGSIILPFVTFQPFGRWKTVWHAWAVFEGLQALFLLRAAFGYGLGDLAQWLPLALAAAKLPAVAWLLRRLDGRPEGNTILAFHGGMLLLYLSSLPVLVLDHGWIGLAFVFESAALLWLNRRIAHDGLRWAALGLAPLGLFILVFNLPSLKLPGAPPVLNSAVLSVACAVAALAAAAHLAGSQQRLLDVIDLKRLFSWAAVGAGFFLLNLIIADIFAFGHPFTLVGIHTTAQALAGAAAWMAYGLGMLIRPGKTDRSFRIAGMLLIAIGLLQAVLFPFQFREAFGRMTPLFNTVSLLFIGCLIMLAYLTLRNWQTQWPLAVVSPRTLWGVVLAVTAFAVLNIEIAGAFGIQGRPFGMLTHGSLAMQLAYSLGWLLYAIGLMAVGIRWQTVRVRWAAIILLGLTAFKIFILDLWSLGQLYRVGSLLGLAVVLILVSYLYQRFLSETKVETYEENS